MNASRPRLRLSGRSLVALTVVTLAAPPAVLRAEDWPQWRGPARNGVSTEKVSAAAWKNGPRLAWKAQIGIGFSSVSVHSDRVYTTGHQKGQDIVWCLDARTGAEVWKRGDTAELGDNLHEGGPAATPTVYNDRVYCMNKWGLVRCLNARSGEMVWKRDLKREEGIRPNEWGLSGSALVWKDRVFFNAGGTGVALDRRSGKTLWLNGKESTGYASPLVFRVTPDADPSILIFAAKSIAAVDPLSGKVRWRHPWRTGYDNNNADPIIAGNRIFITTYDRGAACLGVKNDRVEVVYDKRTRCMNTHMAPAVLSGQHLYGFSGHHARRADFRCVHLPTGEVRWRRRGLAAGSVMLAAGRLIVLDGRGELVLVEPRPEEFHQLATSRVLEGRCWATPALANGRLYVRNARGDLRCLIVAETGE